MTLLQSPHPRTPQTPTNANEDHHAKPHSEALQRGESLVIDATNAAGALRKEWVALLRQAHSSSDNGSAGGRLRVRAVEFRPPNDSAVLHLNCFRGVNPDSSDPRLLPYPALKGIINRLQWVEVGVHVAAWACRSRGDANRHQHQHD